MAATSEVRKGRTPGLPLFVFVWCKTRAWDESGSDRRPRSPARQATCVSDVARTRIVRVVVRFRAGPTWESGPPEEQPGWDEHAAFVDDLVERGIFVMGGPLSDHSGSMTLLENVSEDEARELVARDPFVENGVFVLKDVRSWNVYVDELTKS